MVFFLVFLVVFLLFWYGATANFYNPYRLIILFGPKGCGKTTYLTKVGIRALKRSQPVYANFPLPGAKRVEASDFGVYEFERDCLILIDEAALDWDNRQFKNFSRDTLKFFRFQRHYRCTVYLASQSYDVDKKLRDLADELWLFKRVFSVFSYGKRIIKKIVLTESKSGEAGESRISEQLKFDSIVFFLFGSRRLTFIPRWSGAFDSFITFPLKKRQQKQWLGELSSIPNYATCIWALFCNAYRFYSPYLIKFKSAITAFHKETHYSPTDDEIKESLNQKLEDLFNTED